MNPSPEPTPAAPQRRSTKVRALLALGSVVGVGAVLTTAAFSDKAEVATTFEAGTLDINVDDHLGSEPYPIVFDGGDNLKPGDTVYKLVAVNNAGSLDAFFWLDAEGSGDARGATADLLVQAAPVDGSDCGADSFDTWVGDLGFRDDLIPELVPVEVPAGEDNSRNVCLGVHLPDSVEGSGGGATEATFTFNATSQAPTPLPE